MLRTFATILLLLSCLAPSLAQTHQHGSMPAGEGRFNPWVIADGRGGFYLAYVERAGEKANLLLRHSVDGETFSSPVRVNNVDGDATVRNENPPKLAVAATGEVYVCWANERERWKGDIRFARSTDGGKSFSPAITINSDAGGPPVGHAFQSVAVDRRGRVYVAWIDERNKKASDRGAEIWMSVSGDHGKTFSRDRRILADVCECCRTNIQVDAEGRLFISYRTVPPVGPQLRDIVVARSDDGGRHFTTTKVSHDGWEIEACPVTGPALAVGDRGRITVVWFVGGGERPGLYYTTSNDHGRTYSARRLLDPDQKMGKHAQAIAREDGKVVVAWDDFSDKPISFWGVLDPQSGALEKEPAREGVSYPSIAMSHNTALMTGMRAAAKDILIDPQPLARK